MLLIRAVDGTLMKAIAGTRAPHVPMEMQLAAMRLPDEELSAMTSLAPYAAEYAPFVMKHMKPIMAGAFVGVWAMSCVTRVKTLQAMESRMLAREIAAPVVVTEEKPTNGRSKSH